MDVDETGTVFGIKLLDATEQLNTGDDGKVVFVNALNGERREVAVA